MSSHSRRYRWFEIEAAGVEFLAADAAGEPQRKRFSMTAYTGGPMQVAAYGPPVAIDLSGLKAQAPVPILLNHDHTQIVGHADQIDRGDTALKLSGIVSGAGQAVAEVLGSAANGFPWKASVGARPDKLEFVGEGVTTKVNGKTLTGPLYVARKSTLGEVSFVAVAADGRTAAKVAAAAAQQKELDVEFNNWVQALGLDTAELRDDQIAKLRAKYEAEVKAAAAKSGQPVEAAAKQVQPPAFDLQAVALEFARHEAKIEALVADYGSRVPGDKLATLRAAVTKGAIEAKATALAEQWAAPRLEAEYVKAAALFERDLIRAERPTAPAAHGSTRDTSPQVIEAAFALSCGLRSPEKHYKPEVLEAADRQHRGIGLQELLLMHAIQAGYSGRMYVRPDNLREVLRAAFSTHTLTTILTQTGNKLLLEGFNAIPQSWREIAQVRPVNDFKAVTAFRMTASLEYEEVGPTGEIKHGTVGQESFTMQAKTYARMAALTRQDIINDDLGALNDLRNRLGMGAAMKMNKVFWTAWLAASAAGVFWSAARKNLVASAALAEAGLNAVVQAFRDMAGPDGNLLSLEPVKLLIPSALEATGRKLYTSQEVRDTTANTKVLVANIYQNRFNPVVVPELGNDTYAGYSATTWWLLADPAILAAAIMCFLAGQQSPTIESADADFETLGIQWRGFHDFGVAMSEYRASVKATA